MKPRKYSSWSISRDAGPARRRCGRADDTRPRARHAAGPAARPWRRRGTPGRQGDARRLAERQARTKEAACLEHTKAASAPGAPARSRAPDRSGSATSTARATTGTLPTRKRSPSFSPSRSSSGASTAAPAASPGAAGRRPEGRRRPAPPARQRIGVADPAQLDQPPLAGRRLGHRPAGGRVSGRRRSARTAARSAGVKSRCLGPTARSPPRISRRLRGQALPERLRRRPRRRDGRDAQRQAGQEDAKAAHARLAARGRRSGRRATWVRRPGPSGRRHPRHAVGAGGQRLVVGHQHQRRAGLGDKAEHQVGDVGGVVRGRGCRWARRRTADPGRPPTRGPGPPAAARRRRAGADSGCARGQADALQPVAGGLGRAPVAGDLQRRGDVLLGGHVGQQVEGLEHQRDAAAPQPGPAVLVQRAQILAEQPHIASGRAAPAPRRRRSASTCREPDGPTTATRSPARRRSRRRAESRPGPPPRAGSGRRRRALSGAPGCDGVEHRMFQFRAGGGSAYIGRGMRRHLTVPSSAAGG